MHLPGVRDILMALAITAGATTVSWSHMPPAGASGQGTRLATNSRTIAAIARAAPQSAGAATKPNLAWAWGDNQDGELGNGTFTTSSVPAQVISLTNVVAVAGGGYHSLALKSDGTVWAWGYDADGELGNGTYTLSRYTAPVQVVGPGGSGFLNSIVAIAAGAKDSMALNSDGTVWTWGDASWGELGAPTSGTCFDGPCSTVPMEVSGPGGVGHLTGIVAIAAGSNHNMALKSDGTVWSWGSDVSGELGNGTLCPPPNCDSPTPVLTHISGVMAIGSGDFADHSLAVKSDGTVWAWGDDSYEQSGQPCHGPICAVVTPMKVSGIAVARAVAGGADHSLAVTAGGKVWAWGDNSNGQLGNGGRLAMTYIPVRVHNLSGAVAVAAGHDHSLALRGDGTAWAWGDNLSGELGIGTYSSTVTLPMQVLGLSEATAIAAGQTFGLAAGPASASAITAPASIYPLQTITVTGSGFGPGMPVMLYLDTINTTPLATITTTGVGTFVATFPDPQAAGGGHTLIALGHEAGGGAPEANTAVTLKSLLTLTPSSGPVGTSVIAQGYGFGAGLNIELSWDYPHGPILVTTFSNAQGSFTAAFTVPSSTPGMHVVTVTDPATVQPPLGAARFTVS